MLNELCTNAVKYGALSAERGTVLFTWERDPLTESVTFRWVETDGPTVVAPSRRGFGSRLVEEALPRQLGGHTRLSFPVTGVEFELVVPAKRIKALPPG
jgi:two-component sensor histidine kinase